jgi:hypothetical protein
MGILGARDTSPYLFGHGFGLVQAKAAAASPVSPAENAALRFGALWLAGVVCVAFTRIKGQEAVEEIS